MILGVPKLGTEASFVVNALYNDKTIMGCRYGAGRPHHDIPLFVELYLAGRLKLDELVTKTYPPRAISSARSTTCTTATWPAACSRSGADMALPAELAELAASVSNWGRWGDDDERGTANLIDDAALRRGLAAVRSGQHLSLAIPLDQRSPQQGGAPGRLAPLRTMLSINQTYTGQDGDAAFNDDTVVMAMSAGTHIDALGHVSYGGQLYNGFAADTVTRGRRAHALRRRQDRTDHEPRRAARPAGDARRRSTRGGLRRDRATTSTPRSSDAGVDHRAGRRAVRAHRTHASGSTRARPTTYNHDSPGLSTHTIRWIRDHDCGAVFTDTYVYEVWPPQDWAAMMVVHMIHLRDMGQLQGQNFDFEALAAACAGRRRARVPVHAPIPSRSPGGCSAPVHPVATR